MIEENTRTGSTVWHLRNVDDFVYRALHFEDGQEALNWLIRKCKIVERASKSHYDCPGYFWVAFSDDDSHAPQLCSPRHALFLTWDLALAGVSSPLKLARLRAEKEMSKICAAERVISNSRTKEIDND